MAISKGLNLDSKINVTQLELAQKGIVAESPKMQEVIRLARRVAKTRCTVLITGESGTGKEIISQLIHEWGDKPNTPYIKVNCGAIPETLLESELFGYERGAFTGASKEGRPGKFELAHNGTILLDEIGELPLNLQVKLLRVLQDQEITRIGGTAPRQITTRVICATNKNLKELLRQGKFREDLFFRLNVIPLHIPPLRERKEDIMPLIRLIKKRLEQKYGIKRQCPPEVRQVLFNYDWPGNVRELENTLERAFIMTEPGEVITSEKLIRYYLQTDWERTQGKFVSVHKIGPLKSVLQETEQQLITLAYEKLHTTKRVCSALQVDQSTISRKMRKLGICKPNNLNEV